MNIIDKLIEESTRVEDYYPAGCNGYPHQTHYFDKEKFAKLIADHCASIAYRHEHGDVAAMDILSEFNVDDCRNWK